MLPSLPFPPLPIPLKLLRDPRLQRIIRHRLPQQILHRNQHAQNLATGLPSFAFQDPDAHAAFLVIGDIRVVDAGFEVDDGGFEGVVGWEGEEKVEFAALGG